MLFLRAWLSRTQLPGGGWAGACPQQSVPHRLQASLHGRDEHASCPEVLFTLTLHLPGRTLRPFGLWPLAFPTLLGEEASWRWRPRAHRIPFTCNWAPPSFLTGSPTRSHVEPGSLTESHRLKEALRGGLDPLLREKMQTPVTMASEGRGQAAALERPDSPPLQSFPICILLPLFPSAGDAAAWPLSGRVLWLPLKRQEEGHSITTLLSNKGLHF